MINPLKLARFGLALALDATGEILAEVEHGLNRAADALNGLAARLDPGEEYVPIVKASRFGQDGYWISEDFEAAFQIIERTRDIAAHPHQEDQS